MFNRPIQEDPILIASFSTRSYWAPVNSKSGYCPIHVELLADVCLLTVSWGYESRLASVRLISPPLAAPKATRLEIVSTHFARIHRLWLISLR